MKDIAITKRLSQVYERYQGFNFRERVLIALAVLAFTACARQGNSDVGDPAAPPAIPPIDLAAPRQTETAAFALG